MTHADCMSRDFWHPIQIFTVLNNITHVTIFQELQNNYEIMHDFHFHTAAEAVFGMTEE